MEAELRKLSSGYAAGHLLLGNTQRLLLFRRLSPFGPARRTRVGHQVERERSVRAVLFDLRDNGGGVLKAAVQSSRLVVPHGSHILSLQKERRGTMHTVSSFRRRWYHRSTPFGAGPRRRFLIARRRDVFATIRPGDVWVLPPPIGISTYSLSAPLITPSLDSTAGTRAP